MSNKIVTTGIEFDTRDMVRAIERAERRLNALENEVDDAGRAAKKAGGDFDNLGKRVIQLAAAYGVFTAARGAVDFIFDTNVEFQRLEATLGTVTGSVERGATAFELITKFAAETPFEVKGVTDAFIALRVRGVDPTVDRMRGLGNFASAFSRDITNLTDAVASAVAGNTETLRAMGVTAKREGDQIKLSFGDVSRTVGATAENISAFLAEIGNTQFAGAMADRMDTLEGKISLLKDSSALLARDIGQAGLNGSIGDLVDTLDAAVKNSDDFAETLGQALASGVHVADVALEAFIEHLDLIITGLQILTGAAIARGIMALGVRITALAVASGSLGTGLLALAGGPVGAVVLLAGALGGILLPKLLSAKNEASELADILERVSGTKATSSDLLSAVLLTQTKLQELQAKKKTGFGGQDLGSMDPINQQIGATSLLLEDLKARWMSVSAAEAAATSKGGAGGAGSGADARAEAVRKLTQSLEEQRIELSEGKYAAMEYSLSLQGITGDTARGLIQQQRMNDLNEEANAALEKLLEQERARQESVVKTIDGLREQQVELLGGAEALLRRRLALQGATADEIELAAAILRTNEAEATRRRKSEEESDKAERAHQAKLNAQEEQLRSTSDRMAGSITDSLADMAMGTEGVKDAFSDMVSSILRDMMRLAAQKHITGPLADILMGLLGSGVSAASKGASGFTPLVVSPPRFRAAGGPVDGGTPYVVGEMGPELFVPKSNGSIVPNNRLGGGGGQTVHVHQAIAFHLASLDPRSHADLLQGQRGTIAKIVAEAARDSSGFRGALR